MIKLVLAMFLCSSLFAQDQFNDPNDQEGQFSKKERALLNSPLPRSEDERISLEFEQELEKLDKISLNNVSFEEIRRLKIFIDKYNRPVVKAEKQRKILPQEFNLEIYPGVLKKGSAIFELKDQQKGQRTTRDLTIYASQLYAEGNITIIYNSDKMPLFYTRAENVKNITETTSLFSDVDHSIVYEPKKSFSAFNDKLLTIHQATFQTSAKTTTYDYTLWINTPIKLQYGIHFNVQRGESENDLEETVSWDNANYGIYLRKKFLSIDSSKFYLKSGLEKSFLYRVFLDGGEAAEISTLGISVGLEGVFPVIIGKLVLGGNYKNLSATIERNELGDAFDLEDQGTLFSNVSLYIGYEFDLNI